MLFSFALYSGVRLLCTLTVTHLSAVHLVQFRTPSPVMQRRGERVQDHLSAHARRLASFIANDYCACENLAWQYGGGFEGIGRKVQEKLFGIRSRICTRG